MAEFVGRRLMLDVLDQMNGQPDHWVLVRVALRRIRIAHSLVADAIGRAVARGWLETDTTFARQQRVRLTAEGRALLGDAILPRMRLPERPRVARPRVLRQALRSRSARAFAVPSQASN
jgi:hypothetical protein